MTRLTWIANETSQVADEVLTDTPQMRAVESLLEDLVNALPAEVRDTLETGHRAMQQAVLGPLAEPMGEALDFVLDEVDPNGRLATAHAIGKRVEHNLGGLIDLFSDSSICTLSNDQLKAKLDNILGPVSYGPVAVSELNRTWLDDVLDFLVPTAHAASGTQMYGFAGVNVQLVLGKLFGGGISFDLFGLVGDDGAAMGMAVGGVGAFNNPVLAVNGFGGVKFADSMQDIGGVSIPIAMQAPLSSRGFEGGLTLSVRDPEQIANGRYALESVTFDAGWGSSGEATFKTKKMKAERTVKLGRASRKNPVEGSVGVNYEWLVFAPDAPEVATTTVELDKGLAGTSEPDTNVSGANACGPAGTCVTNDGDPHFSSGDEVVMSPSGSTKAYMQADCNFVVYRSGVPVWASQTYNSAGGCALVMQEDGNVVIYRNGNAIWATGDTGSPRGRVLTLTESGVLQLTDSAGKAVWQSNQG
jgi:hypothetical protein